MKTGALAFILLFFIPSICWGQAPPQGMPVPREPGQTDNHSSGLAGAQPGAPQQPPPARQRDLPTDVFGRPVFTDIFRADYLSRAFNFWPFDLDAPEGFHLAAVLKEEYSSNLNLTDTDRKDDFITTVSPGVRYVRKDGPADVDLTYIPGYNIYAKNSDLNYWSHFGTLNSAYRLDPRWTIRLRDILVRTDDPLEYDPLGPVDQYFLSTSMERNPHLRNIAEPQIEYRFGQEDYFGLLFRNMYYNNDDPAISDGMENTINPRLMYWFNIHNGFLLDYSYTWADLNDSPNWTGHDARGRYIYRLSPGTSFFVEYYFADREFDPPSVSYQIHSPAVGASHAFSPSFSAALQLGYYIKDPESGDSESSFSVNASMSKKAQLSTYNLILIWGFREEYLTAENLGFIEYRRAEANFVHSLTPRLNFSLIGIVEKADYTTERRDWIYGGSAGLSWNILKWLSLTPAAWYRVRNSNTDSFDYKEFRGILRLTATY